MAIRRPNDTRRAPAPTTTPAPAVTPAPTKPTGSAATPAADVRASAPASAAPRRRAKPQEVSPDTRRAMIAESAYLRSERRGFAPGFEEEDWLAAEKEVDALLSAGPGASQ
jgi:Protein of unknown function (DUF2934)